MQGGDVDIPYPSKGAVQYEQSSTADRARLLSVSSPHAASWVSVILSEGLGLHLQPSEFQVHGHQVVARPIRLIWLNLPSVSWPWEST